MASDPGSSESKSSPPSAWAPGNRALTLGLILTVAGAAFEALAVATTLPTMVDDLGGLALYGWAFSAFMLTNLVGTTIAGGEADQHGPARPFIAGVVLFSLGLVVAGFAPTMPIVIAGRAVQGLGAGAIGAIAYVVVGRGYPESARPHMLALLSSAWVVPGLIGPALAGLIADYAGWRWVFLGLAPLTPLAAALALPALRRFGGAGNARRDWSRVRAALRLTFGVGLVVAGLGLDTFAVAIGPVVVGTALALPALRGLLPAGTLRAAPGLPAALATGGLLNFAFFGVDAFVPLAITSGRGQSATVGGLALTAATIAWSSAAWVQAHLASRQSRRTLVIGGLLLVALGIGGVLAGLVPAVPVVLLPLAWGVAGLGMGFAYSTTTLVILERAPPGEEGAASAALQLLNGLGIALGTGLGGVVIAAVVDRGRRPSSGIAIQGVLMLALIALAVWTATRLPAQPTRAPEATGHAAENEVARAQPL